MRTARRIKIADLRIGDVIHDVNGVAMTVSSVVNESSEAARVDLLLGKHGDVITITMASQRLVTTWEDDAVEEEVRSMGFGPLERLTTDRFDLVKLDEEVKVAAWGPTYLKGTWTLQYGGRIWFALPNGLPKATVDFSEEEVAAMFFDNLLTARTNAVQIGYDAGKTFVQTSIKELLGVTVEGTVR